MPRALELSIEKRVAIVAEFDNGISAVDLAKKYKCSRSAIYYQVSKQKKYYSVRNKSGRGRKRVTTEKEDSKIRRFFKINPSSSVKNVVKNVNHGRQIKVSERTVRRRMKNKGLKAYVVRKKPHITPKNQRLRLEFAKEHVNKPPAFWKNILWTDETAISLDGTYGRKFYYSDTKGTNTQPVTMPTRHSKGGKILVWGCTSYNGIGPIVRCPEKMNQSHYLEILNEVALVAGDKLINSDFTLQQDNAPIHTSRLIKKYLSDISQNVLKWPPQSPDLNVIENLWHYLKSNIPIKVGRLPGETWQDVIKAWSGIETEMLQNLINSMPRRLEQVIAAKGGNTSY